jgi:transcriptional regulator with XRE-family HTH domain
MSFSDNLRMLLKHKNIKQSELTEALGITKTRVSNYLSGRSEPDYKTLNAIADILNVTVDSLLNHVAPMENIPQFFDYSFPVIEKQVPLNKENEYIPVYNSATSAEFSVKPYGYIRYSYSNKTYGCYALHITNNDLSPYITMNDIVYIKPCSIQDIVSTVNKGSIPVCSLGFFDGDSLGLSLVKCIFKNNYIVCQNNSFIEVYNIVENAFPLKGILFGIWRKYV